MSRFVARSTYRYELGDGDWVELRSRLAYGERLVIQDSLLGARRPQELVMRNEGTGEYVDEVAPLHLADANLALLTVAIVAWGGPGFCSQEHEHAGDACTPRPITRENIESLDTTGERLLAELERNMVRGTADFTRPRPPSTPDTAAAADGSSSSPSSAATAGPSTS